MLLTQYWKAGMGGASRPGSPVTVCLYSTFFSRMSRDSGAVDGGASSMLSYRCLRRRLSAFARLRSAYSPPFVGVWNRGGRSLQAALSAGLFLLRGHGVRSCILPVINSGRSYITFGLGERRSRRAASSLSWCETPLHTAVFSLSIRGNGSSRAFDNLTAKMDA